jgi:hypothetical protein
MYLRTLILGLVVAGAAMAGASHAQAPDRARIEAAKEMMRVSGAARQFDEAVPLMFNQLANAFAQMAPGKDGEIRDVFAQMTPRFLERKNELMDQIAELYAVIAFYKSPVGIRFADIQPKIMRDSMALGQRWGERIGLEFQEEARRELARRGINMSAPMRRP